MSARWAVLGMVDCKGPESVEVRISQHGDSLRLWINVDGVCAFRAYDVPKAVIHVLDYNQVVVEPKGHAHDRDHQD
jgi:hypothetical protein